VRRPFWDLGEVFTPGALIVAFVAVVGSALWDDDTLMNAAGVALLIDAAKVHVGRKLRER
jgi:uncharacterized membrane protein YfcA